MDWAKTTARRGEKHLNFEIWCGSSQASVWRHIPQCVGIDQHQNERRSYLVTQELPHGNLSFIMLSEFRPIVGDGFVIRYQTSVWLNKWNWKIVKRKCDVSTTFGISLSETLSNYNCVPKCAGQNSGHDFALHKNITLKVIVQNRLPFHREFI